MERHDGSYMIVPCGMKCFRQGHPWQVFRRSSYGSKHGGGFRTKSRCFRIAPYRGQSRFVRYLSSEGKSAVGSSCLVAFLRSLATFFVMLHCFVHPIETCSSPLNGWEGFAPSFLLCRSIRSRPFYASASLVNTVCSYHTANHNESK